MSSKVLGHGAGLTMVGRLLWFSCTATAPVRAQFDNLDSGKIPLAGTQTTLAAPLLILFQGRLPDPGSGQPKPHSTYAMTFSLSQVNTGGSAAWTETKTIGLRWRVGPVHQRAGDIAVDTSLPCRNVRHPA